MDVYFVGKQINGKMQYHLSHQVIPMIAYSLT